MFYKMISKAISMRFNEFNTWDYKEKRSSTFWTSRIKEALESANKDKNVELRYTDRSNGVKINFEYLFDFVYLQTGKKRVGDGYFSGGNIIRKVVAIVESEFRPNSKGILYDFAKLLIGKGELKVMIYYHRSNDEAAKVNSEIRRMIAAFTQKTQGEKYLICWFNQEKTNFNYQLINGNGKLISSW